MDKVGVWLRKSREAKGSTLEEAEESTRIRAHFLKLLETGDFAALPGGEVQTRGFLRIYARYLDLPTDEVLSRYDAEAHGNNRGIPDPVVVSDPPPQEKEEESEGILQFRPYDIPISSSLPRWMSLETLMVVGMVLVVLLAIIAVVSYLISQQAGASALPTAITPKTIAAQEMAPTSRPIAITTTTSAPDLSSTETSIDTTDEVTLTLEATEHVWVSVTRDTQTVFEGMMAPGQPKSWTGQEAIGVKTGNGAALQVTVNGQAQGPMGGRNQISTRAWGPKGELTTPEASMQ